MATVNFKLATDMSAGYIWYGDVLKSSATQILIWEGYSGGDAIRYNGTGFRYSNGEVVGGVLKSVDYAVDVRSESSYKMLFQITGLNIDAISAARYVKDGDYLSMVEFVASGNDKFNGSSGNDHILAFAGNDSVFGNKGDDYLEGGSGNDTLSGGVGNDLLLGDIGNDTFVFDSNLNDKSNVDTISDFESGQDHIALKASLFKKLGSSVSSDEIWFKQTTTTQGKTNYLVYDSDNGVISYDADGSGKGSAVRIAIIGTDNHANISAADFVIV